MKVRREWYSHGVLRSVDQADTERMGEHLKTHLREVGYHSVDFVSGYTLKYILEEE